MKKVLFASALLGTSLLMAETLNSDDQFYQDVVQKAPNAKPILVKDTDSAMGRYNLHAKKLDIHTLARAHGHLCDGLVLAYVELSNTLPKLFKDGVVDRTDLRVVAKNSPCLVDTSALMSGARINHKRLSLDNTLGGSFIVQRISTGETYKVALADSSFLRPLKAQEKLIKEKRAQGKKITAADIDKVEALAFEVMKTMLYADPNKLLKITKLPNYVYTFSIEDLGPRSDIVNRDVPRK